MSSQPQGVPAPLGVGILGAGPVTQAIHLPSLARLRDILEVRHIMDVDHAVAESVARRMGARFSTSLEELLADPEVDIVAICSPHQFHAAQVIAACRAGKKAVLCEKPFAMSGEEAASISAVSVETGVPIIVGAMHTFDPGWLAAEAAWGDFPHHVHTVRSSIVLPPNARFEDFATEIVGRAAMPPRHSTDPEIIKAMLTGGVMGLAIIYVGSTMTVATWMMASYFDSIPISLEEASWIDGCSVFGSFTKVVLRNSLPGVLSTAIFAFLLAWNDYLVAIVFLRSNEIFTLPMGVQSFFQQNATDWTSVMALAVVMMLPPIIVVAALNRYFSVGGMAAPSPVARPHTHPSFTPTQAANAGPRLPKPTPSKGIPCPIHCSCTPSATPCRKTFPARSRKSPRSASPRLSRTTSWPLPPNWAQP
ncbi:MAG: Gfo/Idh/MocA family oxidoreductase [Arthrobacter sp.]|nr:Gfo/Idh/MocA family oxidoreductase [Arthrobacter sp.]